MTAIVITDQATRAEIAVAIAALRTKATRYSLHDRRRVEIDDEVDLLVEDWMSAEA